MKLKETMQVTGLSQKAIRYYEQSGLIQVKKQTSGFKEYDEDTIHTLCIIKYLRSLRFSLTEIEEILNNQDVQKEILMEKIKSCDQEILVLHEIKQQLKDFTLHEKICIPQVDTAVSTNHKYMLITNPEQLLGKMNVVILGFSALFVFTQFSQYADLSMVTPIITSVSTFMEYHQHRNVVAKTKDGYEDIQMNTNDIIKKLTTDICFNVCLLWTWKIKFYECLSYFGVDYKVTAAYLILLMFIILMLLINVVLNYDNKR